MNRKYRVIAGPYSVARKYALSHGWSEDEVFIITRGHQLATLDPALIVSIVTIKLHTMGERIMREIEQQIDAIRVLWPVDHLAAA